MIYTESGFSKKKRVHGGEIKILDQATGKVLVTGKTDDNGEFSCPVPREALKNKTALVVELNASQGHKAKWTIGPDEFLTPGGMPAEAAPSPQADIGSAPAPDAPAKSVGPQDGDRLLAEVKTLQGQVRALTRIVVEDKQAGPGLTEIIGGLGYILGLVGLAAYFKRK